MSALLQALKDFIIKALSAKTPQVLPPKAIANPEGKLPTYPWINHALQDVGITEAKNMDKILSFFIKGAYKSGLTKMSEIQNEAWCAAWVGAKLEEIGIRGTGMANAKSYLNWGYQIDTPSYGAIAVFNRGSNPAEGHVAFIVGTTDGQMQMLGGNQSNSVCIQKRDRKDLVSIRWSDEFAKMQVNALAN